MRAVLLAEALDVRRADEAELLRRIAGELDQPLVADRHPLDRLAPLRLDHRARNRVQAPAFEVAEDVDRELLAGEARLHDRIDGRVAEEEAQLRAVLRPVDVPRAETAASLDEEREPRIVRDAVRQPRRWRGDAQFLEEHVREVLVAQSLDDLGVGQEDQGAQFVTRLHERDLVEVGERDDEAHIVLVDERTQRRHVALVVHTRDERVAVGTVERGSERVHVYGDGRRPGATERSHDVDALTRAGE